MVVAGAMARCIQPVWPKPGGCSAARGRLAVHEPPSDGFCYCALHGATSLKLRSLVQSAIGRCPVALHREITNESEESVRRHSCRWMLHNSVPCCSERRARSGG